MDITTSVKEQVAHADLGRAIERLPVGVALTRTKDGWTLSWTDGERRAYAWSCAADHSALLAALVRLPVSREKAV